MIAAEYCWSKSEMNNNGNHSGAAAIPYRIEKKYLGEVEDELSISEMEDAARFAGGDFALELKGERLHLFRVIVRDVS